MLNLCELCNHESTNQCSCVNSFWVLIRHMVCSCQKRSPKVATDSNRARPQARLVLHCPYHTSSIQINSRLSWLPSEAKLWLSLLLFIRKTILSANPDFLLAQLAYSGQTHTYQTRQVSMGQLSLPRPETNNLKHTNTYRASSEWNQLPIYISQTSSYSVKILMKNALNYKTWLFTLSSNRITGVILGDSLHRVFELTLLLHLL